jgi:hypothetical protein
VGLKESHISQRKFVQKDLVGLSMEELTSKQCVSAWQGKRGNVIMERELNGFIQKGELKWKKKAKMN